MTNPNKTEIICILDRSGSMASTAADMRGGFDAFIAEQRNLPGECAVTLVQFDNEYECVYAGRPVAEVPPLVLVPRGSTALLDAIGKTINETGARFAAMPEEQRPGRVMVVIVTDGQENASEEFRLDAVRAMVDHQRSAYSWEFIYLGANQDAYQEASRYGIQHAVNYSQSTPGSNRAVFRSVSHSTTNARAGKSFAVAQADYDAAVESEEGKAN